jgi:hypothetical protein
MGVIHSDATILVILGHKGKYIGAGMFLVGVGSLVLISPHFFAGTYSAGSLHSEVCDPANSAELCAGSDAGKSTSNQ